MIATAQRFLVLWPVLAALAFSFVGPSQAAEMLYVEQTGCVWCKKVNEEIVPAWDKTEEGQRAALRAVNIDKGWPEEWAHLTPARLTPTFILVEGDKEIARLTGYPGDHFFWPMINEMLARLPQPAAMN